MVPAASEAPGVVVSERVVTRDVVGDRSRGNAADSRIDRLITALESRLGIQPEPAVQGDPIKIFDALPIIEVTLKGQDGSVHDRVQLDTKLWARKQLGLQEPKK